MSGLELRANPFVGLRPFFFDDSLYFFGREQQTAELLAILHEHRFLGVVGSSGSGKSSLVRAGLIPTLLGGFLVEDRDHWHIVQVKPGDAPLANLAAALLAALGKNATPAERDQLEQRIRDEHTDAVVEFLAPRLERKTSVFLLVDQFEEIFAFRGIDGDDAPKNLDPARRREQARRKAEAADFVDLIMALAARHELPVYVTLTMRTDFLGDCDLFYGFPEALNRGRYLVPRMTRQQLGRAIESPAKLMRVKMAPRLLDHLLNELGDRFDRLPVLQHALLRTWDGWKQAGGVGAIDLQHFETAGGLERALDQDAEAALKGLDIDVTARVFKRLTDTDLSQRRVRNPARISELMAAAGASREKVEAILRRFEEDGRSFVHPSADGKPDDPRVDISHESLIRQWDRLRNWVDEERRSRDQYVELVARARKRESGRAALLWDPELQTLLDWREQVVPSLGWAERYRVADGDFESATRYLDQSLEARSLKRAEAEVLRRWNKIWNPLILLILVLGAATVTTERASVVAQAQRASEPPAASAPPGEPPAAPTDVPTAGDARAPASAAAVPERGNADDKDKAFRQLFEYATKFWYLGLFVLAYLGLSVAGRRLHRNLRLPVVLRDIGSSGGRSAAEVKEIAATEARDAVVVHDTVYASTWRRVAGYFIDLVPHFLLAIVAMMIIIPSEPDAVVSDAATATWFGACLVLGWLYEVLQIASKRQATLGMRAVGIFRTDLNGQRLTFARASVWWLSRLLSYVVYGLGFISQPFTPKRQTLHDLLAGSVALQRRPQASAPQ